MNDLILVIMGILGTILIYLMFVRILYLEKRIETLTVWAEELEEWLEQSNEHGWIPLDEIKIEEGEKE